MSADEGGWRTVRHVPDPPPAAPTIVLLDDDDDVQICSPRSFAKAIPQCADDDLELSLGPTRSKQRTTRQYKRKRVQPQSAVDLTKPANTLGNVDCEVLSEQPKKVRKVSEEIKLTCAICYDTMKEETSTVCGHIFCANCINSAIKAQKKCPTCRRKLTPSMVHRIYIA